MKRRRNVNVESPDERISIFDRLPNSPNDKLIYISCFPRKPHPPLHPETIHIVEGEGNGYIINSRYILQQYVWKPNGGNSRSSTIVQQQKILCLQTYGKHIHTT